MPVYPKKRFARFWLITQGGFSRSSRSRNPPGERIVARQIDATLVSLHVIPFAGLDANNSTQNEPDYRHTFLQTTQPTDQMDSSVSRIVILDAKA